MAIDIEGDKKENKEETKDGGVSVTVCVPAYNTRAFISKAVKSVLRQAADVPGRMEILIIDDGSTDGTCRELGTGNWELGTGNCEVRVMRQENHGVAYTRARLVEESRGEWLVFMDSDDLMAPGAFLHLFDAVSKYKVAYKTNADIVVGRMERFTGDAPMDESYGKNKGVRACDESYGKNRGIRRVSVEEYIGAALYQTWADCSLSAKMFRRELFTEEVLEEFRNGEVYEDLNIFVHVSARAKDIVDTGQTLYYYRQREGSILHTFHRGRLDVLKVTRRIVEFVEREMPALADAAHDREMSAHFNMLGLMLGHAGYESDIEESRGVIRRYRGRVLFNRKSRLKSRLGALVSYLPRGIFDRLLRRWYK